MMTDSSISFATRNLHVSVLSRVRRDAAHPYLLNARTNTAQPRKNDSLKLNQLWLMHNVSRLVVVCVVGKMLVQANKEVVRNWRHIFTDKMFIFHNWWVFAENTGSAKIKKKSFYWKMFYVPLVILWYRIWFLVLTVFSARPLQFFGDFLSTLKFCFKL